MTVVQRTMHGSDMTWVPTETRKMIPERTMNVERVVVTYKELMKNILDLIRQSRRFSVTFHLASPPKKVWRILET